MPENAVNPNGTMRVSIREILERIEKKVDGINQQGCAHRNDDLRRIKNLESWRDRGIIGILTLAVLTILRFFGINLQ